MANDTRSCLGYEFGSTAIASTAIAAYPTASGEQPAERASPSRTRRGISMERKSCLARPTSNTINLEGMRMSRNASLLLVMALLTSVGEAMAADSAKPSEIRVDQGAFTIPEGFTHERTGTADSHSSVLR